ncbi:hypothetical protein [Rufibacter roseus]|uniref:Cytochrome c domain-containing protein n=1 Tax=Rufibacter roseus TaxID=1567108 RepID=A0ABW2DMQ5_9BACT|nr:hypothetical protein [Rufibacter roseus]
MKKPQFLKFIVLSIALPLLAACASDKEEDVKPTTPPTNQPPPCVTSSVTYSNTISSIMSSSCNSCHNTSVASGGVVLDTYAGVRAQALNGKLVGVITHAAGFPAMPQGGAKLSDCNIAKIRKWVDDGALNN